MKNEIKGRILTLQRSDDREYSRCHSKSKNVAGKVKRTDQTASARKKCQLLFVGVVGRILHLFSSLFHFFTGFFG